MNHDLLVMNKMNSRRSFIKNASLGTVATLALPQIVSAAFATKNFKRVKLDKNDVILFQGDSITDWGATIRNRRQMTPGL